MNYQISETLRIQMERCSSLQGFMILSSVSENCVNRLLKEFHDILEFTGMNQKYKIDFPICSTRYHHFSELDEINEMIPTSFLQKRSHIIFPFDIYNLATKEIELNLFLLSNFKSKTIIISHNIFLLSYGFRFQFPGSYNMKTFI